MNEPYQSMFPEIREGLARLESNVPRRIDAMAISPVSKLPFKAMRYRAALMWRMAELGRGALEHFENDKLAAAIQLTRAAVETSAALWYLHGKDRRRGENGSSGRHRYLLNEIAHGQQE